MRIRLMSGLALVALAFFCAGCGSSDKRDVPDGGMNVSISRARAALEDGNLIEAENQARLLLRSEESGVEAAIILGEALMRQRKMEDLDRELSPHGKAYLLVQSARSRQEAMSVLESGSPVGKLVILESLSYAAGFASPRERVNILGPFVVPLENIVLKDDRALGVLALDVLGGIGIESSNAAVKRIAEGGDPLFGYLAKAYMPAGRVESGRGR